MNHEFDSDQDYLDSIAEAPEERDPRELSQESTPEGQGLVYWTWTADAIQSFISDIVSDLKFPMTSNLLAARIHELGEWFEELHKLEAAA